MADVDIFRPSTSAAPKTYTVPGGVEMRLKAVQADFDGSGSAAAWLPCVELVSDAGVVVARAVDPNVSVAAGGSASVSFFPHLRSGSGGTTGADQFPFLILQGVLRNVSSGGGDVLGRFDETKKFTNSAATWSYTTDGSGHVTDVLVNGPCLLDVSCQFKWSDPTASRDRTTLINITPSAAETFNGVTLFGVSPDIRIDTDGVFDGFLRAVFPTTHNNCDINVEAFNPSAEAMDFTPVYMSIIKMPLNPT